MMDQRLLTLKSKGHSDKIRIIEELLEDNPNLGEETKSLIRTKLHSRMLSVSITESSSYLAKAAILAVVYGDIATVPDKSLRRNYLNSLDTLCTHLNIDSADIELLVPLISAIEGLLSD